VSNEPVDPTQIARDIAGCTASHHALLAHLSGLGAVDATTPSRLPDWTIAHVLTHIARNASGHVEMLAGRPQYRRGVEGRNADIEIGSRRSWEALVDDIEATCAELESGWTAVTDWSGTATTVIGDRPKQLLPLLRQREVEIHRVDLGLGYEFADMPSGYISKDLRLWEMVWRARKPMGLTPLPPAVLAVPPGERLAWMVGRNEIEGVEPAGLF
jgi:maleylpyruvate isomerase